MQLFEEANFACCVAGATTDELSNDSYEAVKKLSSPRERALSSSLLSGETMNSPGRHENAAAGIPYSVPVIFSQLSLEGMCRQAIWTREKDPLRHYVTAVAA